MIEDPSKKISLWQKWINVDPKKRILFSLGLFALSASALYIDQMDPDTNPFKIDRKDVTYKTIDYSKPVGQGRVTIVRNGEIIKEE
uniref:Putative uncharacterized protein DDB_G0284813 n=1 Tax=Dictyostelium discoideum TaxID=44689 RepID=Y6208_DICDI|nr:RecName: Full=Putative uncharacterized protein DDB_G0284813; Flags: Precursor [Dictyostelium discoideum]